MKNNLITEYILMQEAVAQDHLWEVYNLLENLLGDKTEKAMAYQMPTYKAKRNVIHFNASKQHIGIYPGPDAIMAFSDEFGDYSFSKGTLRIKYNQVVPIELITKLANYSYELNK